MRFIAMLMLFTCSSFALEATIEVKDEDPVEIVQGAAERFVRTNSDEKATEAWMKKMKSSMDTRLADDENCTPQKFLRAMFVDRTPWLQNLRGASPEDVTITAEQKLEICRLVVFAKRNKIDLPESALSFIREKDNARKIVHVIYQDETSSR